MPDQRLLALARANQLRAERKKLKARLASRDLMLDEVLLRPPPALRSATVLAVIQAARGFGPTKATRLVRLLGEPDHRKLGHLSLQSRKKLLHLIESRYPRALYGAAWRDYIC